MITVDDGVALHVARVDADRAPAAAHWSVPEVVVLTAARNGTAPGPRCTKQARDPSPTFRSSGRLTCTPPLGASFTEWIRHPQLWRGLAGCPVPMRFIAAGADVRPDWPLRQLAALVPDGSFRSVPGVPHDFWATDPDVWWR